MYDIYATDFVFERCAFDKKRINMLMPYAVIHFVLSGEGFINGRKIGKNTAFISFENNRMDYYPSREDPWSYIYLRLGGREVSKAFGDCGFEFGLTVKSFDFSPDLLNLLGVYERLERSNDPNGRKIIANLVFLLFKEGVKNQEYKTKSAKHAEEIKKYIDENFYKKISVNDIAQRLFLNKNYLRTLFVKHFGLAPKKYLQNLRMERAEFLLRSTDEDVKLISNSVGYDDALLFSKMFKRRFGLSPLKYRLTIRNTK